MGLENNQNCSVGNDFICSLTTAFSIGTAVPLAVPDKIVGLTHFLNFIDRGAINHLAVSATGSAQ